jgi:hypothetical protein
MLIIYFDNIKENKINKTKQPLGKLTKPNLVHVIPLYKIY